MRRVQLVWALSFVVGAGGSAFGQNATEAGAGSRAELAEITITATKREQTLQEVPISVSVTNEETLEKAQIRDLIETLDLLFDVFGQVRFSGEWPKQLAKMQKWLSREERKPA